MRIPESLVSLVEHGVVDEVVRSLKSGKEADVYLVASEGHYRVAKVYKDAQSRSFKNRAAYTEGRQVRSSRDQRAMDKGSRYGKAQNEEAWQSAEVDMIYRLDSAGVRVPKPHHFIDGVLLMELVATADGQPAPRLGEVEFSAEEAQGIFTKLLADVVKMLCAGVVHGDLSEFNVLVAAEGPVVIDFPQAVNAARNQGARKMLLRDVENLKVFLQRHAPGTPSGQYAEEMWQLYEKGELTPSTLLTGRFVDENKRANTSAVLDLIEDARRDERFKRQASGRNFRGLGQAAPRGEAPARPQPGAGGAPHRGAAPARPHGPPASGAHPHSPRPPQQQPHGGQRPQHDAQKPQQQGAHHPQRGQQGAQAPRPPQAPHHPPRQQHGPQGQTQQRPPHAPRPQAPHAPRPQQHQGGRPHGGPAPTGAPAAHAPHAPHGAQQRGGPPQHPPRPPQGRHGGTPQGARPQGNPPPRPPHRGRPNPIVETKPVLGGSSRPPAPRDPSAPPGGERK